MNDIVRMEKRHGIGELAQKVQNDRRMRTKLGEREQWIHFWNLLTHHIRWVAGNRRQGDDPALLHPQGQVRERTKLHYEMNLLIVFEDIAEFDDVWM